MLITNKTSSFFDGTLGLGGHAETILTKFPQIVMYMATDLDENNRTYAQKRLHGFKNRFKSFYSNFSELESIIKAENPPKSLSILLDLGVCSTHFDDESRGFTFHGEGELHMGFDMAEDAPAKKFLATATRENLIKIFREYADEPNATKYARVIVETREKSPINTTKDLKDLLEYHTHPKERKKVLTRVFQAIRIAVNDEFFHLEKAINGALNVMKEGDRLGIMSYHSLEDKIVKKAFKKASTPLTAETERNLNEVIEPAKFKLISKKPIVPSSEEIEQNPRARSAKFRILECISS